MSTRAYAVPMSTRDSLVAAAAALLDDGGPAAVTLRGVAARVGVSHNAPYKHFRDKAHLLAAVAAAELDRRTAALAELPPGTDPVGPLRDTLHAYVAWAHEAPQRFRLTFGPWETTDPDMARAAAAAQHTLSGAVAAAQAAGALPDGDPERLSALLRATAHGAADLAASGHLRPDGKGRAGPDDLVDDLLALLAAAAGPRPA